MNKQLITLLAKEQDTVLKNQKERQEAFDLEMETFLKKAKSNSSKLDLEIFKTIMKTYVKAIKIYDEYKIDGYGYPDDLYDIDYNNIGTPEDIKCCNNHNEYKREKVINSLNKLSDKRELELAKIYNKSHTENQIFFFIFEENDKKYSMPVLFNAFEYKRLGMEFYINNGGIHAFCGRLGDINDFLKNVLSDQEKDSKIINNEIIELIKSMKKNFSEREKIRNYYYNRSKRSARVLSLIICKLFIDKYQNNPNTDYSINLYCLYNSNDVLKELGQHEFNKFTNYEMCNCNDRDVYYIRYRKPDDYYAFLPIDELTLAYMTKSLGFRYSIEKDVNKIIISTTLEALEELITSAGKQKRKSK